MDGGSRYIRYLESTYKLIDISCFFFQSIMLSMDGWCFVTLLHPMVSVHQYEKYRFSYHWCCNQHTQRSCYSQARLPKGRFFSTDERQATICNTWVQLLTQFSLKTDHEHCPLYFDRGPLSCNFGVFFVVSHVFTPKNNHRSRTPHVVGGLGFFILVQVDVSENSGTPKSSILIGFSIIFTIHFEVPLFLETPMSTWVGPGSSEVGKVEDLQNNEVLQVGVVSTSKVSGWLHF